MHFLFALLAQTVHTCGWLFVVVYDFSRPRSSRARGCHNAALNAQCLTVAMMPAYITHTEVGMIFQNHGPNRRCVDFGTHALV